MTDKQLYRFSTDAEDEEWRHSSPKGVLRLYDDYGEFNGCMVRVEPDVTWFTIEDPADPRFQELWALGIVKPVPLEGDPV